MELTNDIKIKIFAQYLGQAIELDNSGSRVRNRKLIGVGGIDDGDFQYLRLRMGEAPKGLVHNQFVSNNTCKLVLKPLSSLLDEDAIEVDKMEAWNLYTGGVLSEGTDPKDVVIYKLKNRFEYNFITAQFILSKGYDLPQYLLGNKTLQESGLAIYE